MNDMRDLPGLPQGMAEALGQWLTGRSVRRAGSARDRDGTHRARLSARRAGGRGRWPRMGRACSAGSRPLRPRGLFVGRVDSAEPYLLRITWPDAVQETEDPYSFGPLLGDLDLHLFNEGRHFELAEHLGANVATIDGVAACALRSGHRTRARVSVVGDFNTWDPRRHPMRLRYPAGVWELFVPRLGAGARYKFAIVGPDGRRAAAEGRSAGARDRSRRPPPHRSSPIRRRMSGTTRPGCSSVARRQATDAPITIYEVHAASWLPSRGRIADLGRTGRAAGAVCQRDGLHPCRADAGHRASVRRLLGLSAARPVRAERAVRPAGGFRAASSMRATAPASASSSTGCRRISRPMRTAWRGSTARALYEHEDPREGFHQDWNTYIYNLGRREVQGFLIASGALLAGALPRRWTARRCGGLDAVPRLLAQAGRMGPEHVWRPREPRGDRLSAAA